MDGTTRPSRWKRFVWFLERAVGNETGANGSQIAESKWLANPARDMNDT